VVSSYNDFDPLEEVIVGNVHGFASMAYEPVIEALKGRRPGFMGNGNEFNEEQKVKAERQIETLVDILKREGITVKRPDYINHVVPQVTPDWQIPVGNGASCPRDTLLVVGDEIIECPMSMRSRYYEYRAYRTLMREYFNKGARWTVAPKPFMDDALYKWDYLPVTEEGRYELIEKGDMVMTELEPAFDAADFLRLGKDIIGQHSLATNLSGIEWLRRHLGPEYRVHTFRFKNRAPRHIDDTLVALRPGIVLAAEEHPAHGNAMELFTKSDWRVIQIPTSSYCGSLNTNFLSLDERTVIVEENEKDTINTMETLGCRVIPIAYRDVYPMGGSLHCTTSDIRRRGVLQSYFPHLDNQQ